MTHTPVSCADENCDCKAQPSDLRQLKCNGCGRYSQPSRFDEPFSPEIQPEYVEGCWVRVGAVCPDCNPAMTTSA